MPRRRKSNLRTWDVFLSHATSRDIDYALVHELKQVLEGRGLTVFLDRCVKPTSKWAVEFLDSSISRSRSGVLVWTGAACESVWVATERKALKSQLGWEKTLVLRLDRDLSLPPGVPAGNVFDLRDPRQFAVLAEALYARLAVILQL